MLTVRRIADYFEDKVPSSLAMSFDNVGLLCGFPEREVHRVLLALDGTLDVIAEASEAGAELIITHHPLIFTPMKRIVASDPEGRLVIDALQNGISVISLHTNLDIIEGGVNTMLASALSLRHTESLSIGRVGELEQPVSMPEFLASVQNALSVSGMRYLDAGRQVCRVAVCGGSGGDLLAEAVAAGCDTLLTGEIRHHQWLDGRELGINLIEADHFCTENVVIPAL